LFRLKKEISLKENLEAIKLKFDICNHLDIILEHATSKALFKNIEDVREDDILTIVVRR